METIKPDQGHTRGSQTTRRTIRASTLAKLGEAAHHAITVLCVLMNEGDDDRIRLQAARALLDGLVAAHHNLPRTKITSVTTVKTEEGAS